MMAVVMMMILMIVMVIQMMIEMMIMEGDRDDDDYNCHSILRIQ